jgi:hypothetical protein
MYTQPSGKAAKVPPLDERQIPRFNSRFVAFLQKPVQRLPPPFARFPLMDTHLSVFPVYSTERQSREGSPLDDCHGVLPFPEVNPDIPSLCFFHISRSLL